MLPLLAEIPLLQYIVFAVFIKIMCFCFFGYNLRNHKPANKSAICNRSICFPNAIAKVTHSTGGVCAHVGCVCLCLCVLACVFAS